MHCAPTKVICLLVIAPRFVRFQIRKVHNHAADAHSISVLNFDSGVCVPKEKNVMPKEWNEYNADCIGSCGWVCVLLGRLPVSRLQRAT